MVTSAEMRTTVRPFIQAQGGVTNYIGDTMPNATLEAGARLSSGNLRAEGALRGGTEFGARAEVGYTVPLNGNKVGIDFTAGGNYSQQLASGKNMSLHLDNHYEGTAQGVNYTIDKPMDINYSYKPDMYKAYAGAGLKIAPSDKFNFTMGVEGGYRGNTLSDKTVHSQLQTTTFNPDQNTQITIEHATPEVTFKNHKQEFYVTPKISANYQVNKNLTVGVNGDLNGGGARVCWTF